MNQSKPFSWENKPGVRKLASQEGSEENCFLQKLPPPPCPPESARISTDNSKIPPPPCVFHPPSRPSRRGLKKSDDPFVAAYKECTRSTSKGKLATRDGGSCSKKGLFSFSCKRSCSVRNDNLVRISQLPLEKDRSGIEL